MAPRPPCAAACRRSPAGAAAVGLGSSIAIAAPRLRAKSFPKDCKIGGAPNAQASSQDGGYQPILHTLMLAQFQPVLLAVDGEQDRARVRALGGERVLR